MAALYLGDAAAILQALPAESVDMCVTSPPFWGLRDYKIEGQIGLEPTPEAWLEHILAVFHEVRRVLRPWGTCFVEIGDSYSNDTRGGIRPPTISSLGQDGRYEGEVHRNMMGLKPLDLVGIPFRLALALQADGWWLRSVIIWDKPAPMPESVAGWRWVKCKVKVKEGAKLGSRGIDPATTRPFKDGVLGLGKYPELNPVWADCPGCPRCAPNGGLVLRKGSWRPTEAHSYILMLAKGVPYFANGEAVRERWTDQRPHDLERALIGSPSYDGKSQLHDAQGAVPNIRPVGNPLMGRNLRSVWRIGPEPSSLPHFATYPVALPEKCILAGTSEWGNCPRCGMPWAPVVDTPRWESHQQPSMAAQDVEGSPMYRGGGHHNDGLPYRIGEPFIMAWRPTCFCGLTERVAPVVLDPFVGTGTTCVAAQQLGRKSIGIELNPKYLDMAGKRLEGVPLPLGAEDS